MLKLLKISTVLCSNFNIARGRHSSPNLTDADLRFNQFSYADELQTTAASRFQGLIDILLIFFLVKLVAALFDYLSTNI